MSIGAYLAVLSMCGLILLGGPDTSAAIQSICARNALAMRSLCFPSPLQLPNLACVLLVKYHITASESDMQIQHTGRPGAAVAVASAALAYLLSRCCGDCSDSACLGG